MGEPRLKLLTVEDYWDLPDDGDRHEIVEGVHEVTPSPLVYHQRVSWRLSHLLERFLEIDPQGIALAAPMDVILAPNTVMQPDIVFVRKDRVSDIVRDHIWGAPDLVIEILSPASLRIDRITKKQTYARYGIPEYWIVDPESRTIQQFRLSGSVYADPTNFGPGQTLTTRVLPGLSFVTDEAFPMPA